MNITRFYSVAPHPWIKDNWGWVAAYIAGELDIEAEIITAINATNAKINAILAMHRAHGIIST